MMRGSTTRLALHGMVAVAVLALGGPGRGEAWASSAPLDTLRESSADTAAAQAYAPGAIDISRKLLPEVTATTVPQTRAPSRPPRIDDPLAGAWKYHEARRAAAAGNGEAMWANLDAALEASPGRADYQWWRTLRAIRGFDAATALHILPGSFRSLIADPLSRGRFLAAAHQGALLVVGIFWTVLLLALMAASWRHLSHDLSARIFKDRRHRLRTGLPMLVPLVLLLLKPGWFGLLAALSLPVLVVVKGRARALLAVTWIAGVLLVFPAWPALKLAVPALDPDSEVRLLEQACVMPPSAALTEDLRSRLDEATDPDRRARLTVALAVQEARRGRYTRSNELFARVLSTQPDNYAALVGTANNTYFLGRLDDAVGRYEAAGRQHPRRGEIPYNLAQVYFKKLFVPEATEALERSRALGFRAPAVTEASRGDGYAPVVYPGLTNAEMTAACRLEAANYPALVTISAWRRILGVPGVPLLALVGVPLLVALAVLGLSNRHQDPRDCENCGIPICRTCCKVRDNAWLCAACGETADRARSDMILATLLKNRSRDEGMARTVRIVRLGRLLPGAGHFATGHVLAGWFRVNLIAAGLCLLCVGWIFDSGNAWNTPGLLLDAEVINPQWLPLPAAMWPGWTAIPVLAGLALIASAWLIGLLDGPGLRRGLHERFSLLPAAAHRGTAGAETP